MLNILPFFPEDLVLYMYSYKGICYVVGKMGIFSSVCVNHYKTRIYTECVGINIARET